jgi:hypothetical protein
VNVSELLDTTLIHSTNHSRGDSYSPHTHTPHSACCKATHHTHTSLCQHTPLTMQAGLHLPTECFGILPNWRHEGAGVL